MYCWKFLSQFGPKNPPTILLERSKKVQYDYDNYRASPKNCTQSLLDRIFTSEDPPIVLRDNEYPYNCDEYIKHKVLWINPNSKITTNDIIDYIENLDKNIIYFENIDSNKSIKAIRHFHIFIKEDSLHL